MDNHLKISEYIYQVKPGSGLQPIVVYPITQVRLLPDAPHATCTSEWAMSSSQNPADPPRQPAPQRLEPPGHAGHCLTSLTHSMRIDSRHRPQSSSASRFTASAVGFLLLIQCGERPER